MLPSFFSYKPSFFVCSSVPYGTLHSRYKTYEVVCVVYMRTPLKYNKHRGMSMTILSYSQPLCPIR
jgi:hypothetical protein